MMLTNIVVLILESVKLLFVLCGGLNYRFKKRYHFVWIVYLASVLCLVIKGLQDSDYRVSFFYLVVVPICALAVEGRRKWIVSFVTYLGIYGVDRLLFEGLKWMLSISDETANRNPVVYGALNAASLCLIIVLLVAIQKLYFKRAGKEEYVKNSNRFYLALFAIGLSASLILMVPFTEDSMLLTSGGVRVLLFVFVLFLFLFVIFGVLLIHNYNVRSYYMEQAKINRRLRESAVNYYRMLLEKEEETRRFRHDMAAHLTCVKGLLAEQKIEEAKTYIDTMTEQHSTLTAKNITGNTLLNAIVHDIQSRYPDVKLGWLGSLPEKLKLKDMDVCVVFSNLLTNAFHAASHCEEGGGVAVTIEAVVSSIRVIIENDMKTPIEERKGKLITQKADKRNHGLGMGNVMECVKKNGGIIQYEYTDKNFKVEVVFLNAV